MPKLRSERFDTPIGAYHLEDGVREIFVRLWSDGFSTLKKVEQFFGGIQKRGHTPPLQSELIWLLLRKNPDYVKATKSKSFKPETWCLKSLLDPKIVNPVISDDYEAGMFFRPPLQFIDPRSKLQLGALSFLFSPEIPPNDFRVLLIPPFTSDADILRIYKKGAFAGAPFKGTKASNPDTIIHAALAFYIAESAENKDLARAYRAAEADIFSRKVHVPPKSKSKVLSALKRGQNLITGAPYNLLFSAV